MKPRTKTKSKPQRLTPARRLEELQAFIALCFHCLKELDIVDQKELSNLTGLCVSTIQRLGSGGASLGMRVNTLMVMGAAAGLKLEMNATSARVVVVN